MLFALAILAVSIPSLAFLLLGLWTVTDEFTDWTVVLVSSVVVALALSFCWGANFLVQRTTSKPPIALEKTR